MWRAVTEDIESGHKYRLFENQAPVSFREFVRLLDNNDDFAAWYSGLLAECEYDAYYWEHPPLTLENFDRDAEFVLIKASMLAGMQPNPQPFRSQFDDRPHEPVITFPNLGGDAMLVAPAPITSHDAYPHLAAFLRLGPKEQVDAFWSCVSRTVYENVTSSPKWLSTAGLGVIWLHARLDTQPKYYSYRPYTILERIG